MLGRSPHATRAGLLNNAEIIVWQSSRRLVMALGLGIAAAILRSTGLIAGPAWPIFVIVPTYIALVALLTLHIERRHHVGRTALFVLALADVVTIFAAVALMTPAAYYVRGLLLSLLALQFTQMFFGRTPAITVVIASAVAYVMLLAAAGAHGATIEWAEQGWVLALFLLVALNGMALQASANRRLASLVELFSNAQRGDFSRTFVDERDREPDGITILGRAYNHLRSELATMVLTDPLTHCFNRRGFEQVLTQTSAAAVRRGGELALLAIDIDHFKAINDTAGHLAGDAVLREVAELLTQSSRVGDVVARVGGEEFVILLPNADGETAGVVAERVMATIRAHHFRVARGHREVTVSIGIAAEQVIDPHVGGALRARADEALYVAKRLGRNRVVMWAPGVRSNSTPAWPGFAIVE